MRHDEQKKMNFDLIYIAVVIFSLLIIGLVFTVLEFKGIQNTPDAPDDRKTAANKLAKMSMDNSGQKTRARN